MTYKNKGDILIAKGGLMMVKNIRSAQYPKQDFKSTLEFVQNLDEIYPSRIVSYKEVQDMLGVKTNATLKFSKNVSTASQFGLITTRNKTVQITSLATQILHPVESNVSELKKEAFLNSKLYAELMERFSENKLPTEVTLSNILLNDYNIIKSVKIQAARFFLTSLNQLGMVKNGKIVKNNMDPDKIDGKQSSLNQDLNSRVEDTSDEFSDVSLEADKNDSEFYSIKIPFTNSTAKIEIPANILQKKDDLKLLKGLIDANINVLLNDVEKDGK